MAFPAVYLLACALIFDIPGKACISILLSPSYYAISLLAMAAGFGIWEMRRWAWHLFIGCNLFITYYSAVLAADHGTTHHRLVAYLIFIFIIWVGLSFRVTREMRVPYFLPRIRWWESNPRYRLIVPVQVARQASQNREAQTLDGEILDLSTRGCFIKIRHDFQADEPLRLKFELFGLDFDIEGTVVWRPLSTVTHPKGLGVKFGAMQRPQKRGLRAIEQRLRKIASFYRASRYLMNPEEFSNRMRELNTVKISSTKTTAVASDT